MTKRYQVDGLAEIIELSKGGKKLKSGASHMEVLDNDGATLIPLKVDDAVNSDEAYTKGQADTALALKQNTMSGGNGIDVTSDEISVDLYEGTVQDQLTYLSTSDSNKWENGVFQKLSFDMYVSVVSTTVVVNIGQYAFNSYAAYWNATDEHLIVWDGTDFSAFDLASSSGVDLATIVAGLDGDDSTGIDFLSFTLSDALTDTDTISSAYDVHSESSQRIPDEDDADVTYTGTAATSFLEFDGAKLKVSVLDEDDMVSDSATALPTQQSVKAYVDSQITSSDISADDVTLEEAPAGTFKIKDGGVGTTQLAADAVNGDKIADDSIDSEHLVADSIDSEHYAPNSVDNDALALLSVATGNIQADAIDGTLIADDAVDSEHLASGSIDTDHFSVGAVDNAALASDSVNGDKIADDSIDSEHFVDGSIDEAHVADNAISYNKLSAAVQSSLDSAVKNVKATVTYSGGATQLITNDASVLNAIVDKVMIKIVTPFDAGTLSIGNSGDNDIHMEASYIDLTAAAGSLFIVDVAAIESVGTINAYLSGSPTAGEVRVYVNYLED